MSLPGSVPLIDEEALFGSIGSPKIDPEKLDPYLEYARNLPDEEPLLRSRDEQEPLIPEYKTPPAQGEAPATQPEIPPLGDDASYLDKLSQFTRTQLQQLAETGKDLKNIDYAERLKGLKNVKPGDYVAGIRASAMSEVRAADRLIPIPVSPTGVVATLADVGNRIAVPVINKVRGVLGEAPINADDLSNDASALRDRGERDASLKQAVETLHAGMSPEAQAEEGKHFATKDADGHYRPGDASFGTLALSAAESAPSIITGMGAGALARAPLEAFANILGRKALAATAQSGNVLAVARLARLDKLIASVAAGFGEASVQAPLSGQTVRDQVNATPASVLSHMPRFQELLNAASHLAPEERAEYARATLANELGRSAEGEVFLATLLTGPLAAPAAGRIERSVLGAGENAAVHAAAGRLKEGVQGAVEEGAQETIQSGAQGYLEGHNEQQADPRVDPTLAAIDQAVGGGLAGAALGGGLGALAGGGHATPTTPDSGIPALTGPAVASNGPSGASGGPSVSQNGPSVAEPGPNVSDGEGPAAAQAGTEFEPATDIVTATRQAQEAGVDPALIRRVSQAVIRKTVSPAEAIALLNEETKGRRQPQEPTAAKRGVETPPANAAPAQAPAQATSTPAAAQPSPAPNTEAKDEHVQPAAESAPTAPAVRPPASGGPAADAARDGSAGAAIPRAAPPAPVEAAPVEVSKKSSPVLSEVQNKTQPDPRFDTALEFLAKKGGVNIAAAESEGFDPADMKAQRVGIRHVFHKNGMTLESAGEALSQAGWPVTDAAGAVDKNKVIDLLNGELHGKKAYSGRRSDAAIEAQAAQREADLQAAHQAMSSEAHVGDMVRAPGTPAFAEHSDLAQHFMVLRDLAEKAGATPDEIEEALDVGDDVAAERRINALISRGKPDAVQGAESEPNAAPAAGVGEDARAVEGTAPSGEGGAVDEGQAGGRQGVTPAAQPAADLKTRFAEHVKADPAGALERYSNLEGSDGGRILSPDVAKRLSPEYDADRTRSDEVQLGASWLMKRAYDEAIKQPAPQGKRPLVVLTSGGTGAGKSTVLDRARIYKDAQIVYDGNLSNLASARARINAALEAGKDVHIVHVYRDPAEAYRNGVLPRAHGEEGRPVTVDNHAQMHAQSNSVVRQLAKDYAGDPRVQIQVIENRGKVAGSRPIPLEKLPAVDYNTAREQSAQQLSEARSAGEVNDRIFHASGGNARAVEPQGSPAGSGSSEPDRGGSPSSGRQEGVKPDALFSRAGTPPVFFSAAIQAVEALPLKKAAGSQWFATLSNRPGVKAEELEWMGLKDWLGDRAGVTKDDVLAFMRANEIQVTERSIQDSEPSSEPMDGWTTVGGGTQFKQYTLPGGKNYTELLLTLPESITPPQPHGRIERLLNGKFRVDAPGLQARLFDTLEDAERERLDLGRKFQPTTYRANHFAEPKVVAHVRFNERTDAGGKRVLFLEELQSDWHQAGRKHGYEKNDPAGVGPGVPDAPFKTTWPELIMKRMVRYAAENGFDRIAWTTGEQQADRYDLAEHIDKIVYSKDEDGKYWTYLEKDGESLKDLRRAAMSEQQLTEFFGKEISAKIVRGDGKPLNIDPHDKFPEMELSGLDLKVGGAGMKGFYDTMLPATVNKLVKKWGAKVGRTEIVENLEDVWDPMMDTDLTEEERASAEADAATEERFQAHGFDITPEMRAAALAGQPLFQQGAAADPSSVSQVRDWVKGIIAETAGVVDVRIVPNVDALRTQTGRSYLPDDLNGVYFNGGNTVYLVASQLPTEDAAQRVAVHEVFGHLAMEKFADMQRVIEMVQKLHEMGSKSINELWDEVTRTQPGLSDTVHAKETIALMAERGVKNSLMDRLITAVKNLLRKMGVALEYSERELRELIARAARALRESSQRTAAEQEQDAVADAAYRRGDDDALSQALEEGAPSTPATPEILNRETVSAEEQPELDDAIAEALVGSPAADSDALFSRGGAKEDPEITAIRRRVMANAADEALPLRDRIRNTLHKLTTFSSLALRQAIVDQFASIAAYEKYLNGGKLKDASVSPYKQTVATQNIASVMSAVMKEGVPVWKDGAYTAARDGRKGIVDIFSPIVNHKDGNLLAQWEVFAAAQRAARLIKELNDDGTSREKLFTQKEIDAATKLGGKYPEFRKAFNEWQAFNKQTLDMAEEAGLLDPESRAIWERNDYVPFYRAMNEAGGTVNPIAMKKAVANQKARIRTLHGRDMPLADVFESMLMNTAHLVDASFKNRAAQAIVTQFDGVATSKIKLDVQAVQIDVNQVRRALEAANIHLAASLTPAQKQEWLTFFRRVKPAGDNIVSVMFGGKPSYYEVHDPLLYQSMVQMSPQQSLATINMIFGPAKRLLTRTATAMPDFIVRNWIRDTQSTWIQSHDGMAPIVGAITGYKDYLFNQPLVRELLIAGALNGDTYDNKPGNVKKALTRLIKDDATSFLGTIVSPRTWWKHYKHLQQASENSNRLAVYKNVRKRGGTHAEAAYQAHDVMNFQQRGASVAMQILTMMIPFMNARIQGLDRLQRGFRDNRAAFLLKGAVLAAVGFLLMAIGGGDQRYEDLQEWDRDTYYHLFVGKLHIRIPKGFEVGSLFGTLPERMVRLLQKKDTGRITWEAMKRLLGSTFAFDPTPQLIKPVGEVLTDYDPFTQRAIVGQFNKRPGSPELEKRASTSPTIVALAEAMPDFAPEMLRSPLKLEHLARGYFSSMATFGVAIADRLTRAAGGYPDAPHRPFVNNLPGRLFLEGTPRNTRWQDEIYRGMDAADAAAKAVDQYTAEGKLDRANELQTKKQNLISSRQMLNQLAMDMRAFNKIERDIRNSSMTPKQKEEELEKLNADRNDEAREVAPYVELF